MTSKRTHKIQRILIFLIAIVGLLYVSMYVINWLHGGAIQEGFQGPSTKEGFQGPSTKEGFQANTIPPTCREEYINGKDMFLCSPLTTIDPITGFPTTTASGSNDALRILPTIPATSSVCYTDAYTLMNRTSGMSSFVCFDRPGPRVWDSNAGHYRDFDPILDNDQLPSIETQTVTGFCAAYNAGFAKNLAAYSNVSTTEVQMYNMGFSNLYQELNSLNAMNTRYCSPYPTNGNMKTVCDSNVSTMQTLSNIVNNNSPNSLSNVSSTLGTSRSTIGALIFGTLEPNFYNAGCMKDSDAAQALGMMQPYR